MSWHLGAFALILAYAWFGGVVLVGLIVVGLVVAALEWDARRR